MNDVRHPLCVVGGIVAQARSGREGSGPALVGGEGALAAIGAARLGADVELVGVVGDDEVGSRLRADLIAEGVCVENVVARAGTPTQGAQLPVEGGEALLPAAACAQLTPKDVELARAAITGARVVLVSQDVPQDALERALEIAEAGDAAVVLRASSGEPVADERLVQLDLWVGTPRDAVVRLELEPEDECSPGGLARRIAAQGPRWVALWLGATNRAQSSAPNPVAPSPGGGAVLFDGERVHSHPGLGDGLSDPVALDAFAAALCIAQLENLRPMAALRLAVAAAALGPLAAAGSQQTALPSEEGAGGSFADAARLPRRDLVERRIATPAPPLPSDALEGTSKVPRPI